MDKKEEKGILNKIAKLGLERLLAGILICFIVIIILLTVTYLPNLMNQISTSISGALYSVFLPASSTPETMDQKTVSSTEGEETNVTNNSADSSTKNTPVNTVITETITNPALYYGTSKPDLAIRLLQVGLMTDGSAALVSQNQFFHNDMVGIKFVIRNDGATVTGPWYFTAFLPSASSPVYTSNNQVSLRPGESIFYTLAFTDLTDENIGQIRINTDPLNQVGESNESNNTLVSNITNITYDNWTDN